MSDLERILKLAGFSAGVEAQRPAVEREMKTTESDSVEESKMADMMIAASEMSKEEFAKEYPGFAKDYEKLRKQQMADESLNEGDMMSAADELEAYARENGGIDTDDFMTAVAMMRKGEHFKLNKFVDELDTEPREKILSIVQKHLDEEEIDEEKRYQIRYLPYDGDKFKIVKGFTSKEEAEKYAKAENFDELADEWGIEVMNEAEIDENAFNQAAAAAARAGKDSFEFNGKTYKTKMDKETAHKLDDDVQFESEELEEAACGCCGNTPCDCGPDCDCRTNESAEEILEAPTMDTTQLVILLKNAGLSEEAIEKKINEWANSAPDAAEQEQTSHGEPYENFAQAVNLSLKRYLDAENMKVNVSEHTVENMKALYESKKSKSK